MYNNSIFAEKKARTVCKKYGAHKSISNQFIGTKNSSKVAHSKKTARNKVVRAVLIRSENERKACTVHLYIFGNALYYAYKP